MIDFAENRDSVETLKAFRNFFEGLDKFQIEAFTTWDGSASEINDYSSYLMDHAEARMRFKMPTCNLPWRRLAVTLDGNVLPCCYDFDKKVVLGNLERECLAEIWNGPRVKELRREFLSNELQNPLCGNCSKLYG